MRNLLNWLRYRHCCWQFRRLDAKDKRIMSFLGVSPEQLKAAGKFQ